MRITFVFFTLIFIPYFWVTLLILSISSCSPFSLLATVHYKLSLAQCCLYCPASLHSFLHLLICFPCHTVLLCVLSIWHTHLVFLSAFYHLYHLYLAYVSSSFRHFLLDLSDFSLSCRVDLFYRFCTYLPILCTAHPNISPLPCPCLFWVDCSGLCILCALLQSLPISIFLFVSFCLLFLLQSMVNSF